MRVDVIQRYPDLTEGMVRAGFARIQIGVESADNDVRRSYKRLNVKPESVEKAVRQFYEAGIPSSYAGFIAGGPRETMETMERTLSFAKHLVSDVAPGVFECSVSFLMPLPGTELRGRPDVYGLRLLDPDLKTSSNFNYCTVETGKLDQSTISNFRTGFAEEIETAIRQ